MSFTGDLANFKVKTLEQSYLIHQKVTVDLFTKVIIGTPVQDGRARGNWAVSYNQPFPRETGKKDKSGGETVNRMVSDVADFDGINGRIVYITNNVPYINRLEYEGWSPQQEKGWVRSAINEAVL